MIYDPNGHVATIYRVEADGRIHYMDAHPDNSLTRGFYDLRFVRASPGDGRRLQELAAGQARGCAPARRRHAMPAATSSPRRMPDIADFSDEQFYGNGPRPDDDRDWRDGRFTLNGATLD